MGDFPTPGPWRGGRTQRPASCQQVVPMAAQEGPHRLPRQGHFFICNTISPAPPGLAFHPSYFGVGSRRTHPEKSNSFHMDFQTHLYQPLRAEPASAACPPAHLRVDPAGLPSPSCPWQPYLPLYGLCSHPGCLSCSPL